MKNMKYKLQYSNLIFESAFTHFSWNCRKYFSVQKIDFSASNYHFRKRKWRYFVTMWHRGSLFVNCDRK